MFNSLMSGLNKGHISGAKAVCAYLQLKQCKLNQRTESDYVNKITGITQQKSKITREQPSESMMHLIIHNRVLASNGCVHPLTPFKCGFKIKQQENKFILINSPI